MARSSLIYLCLNADYKPVAAFTVKHECQTWLRKEETPVSWVVRAPDGRFQASLPVFDIASFLED